jgi:hypothetical protein
VFTSPPPVVKHRSGQAAGDDLPVEQHVPQALDGSGGTERTISIASLAAGLAGETGPPSIVAMSTARPKAWLEGVEVPRTYTSAR